MGKKSTHSISPNFQHASYPPSFEELLDIRPKSRNDIFYGAVFNAIDDYLRKNYATDIPPSDIITNHRVKGDQFRLLIEVKCQNDNPAKTDNEAMEGFFSEIYDAIDSEEITDIKRHYNFSQRNGAKHTYVLIFGNKLEVMQLVENILKPYDFGEGYLPNLLPYDLTDKSPLRFEMNPQYSLQHIRALLCSTQGRSPEGHGLHLTH